MARGRDTIDFRVEMQGAEEIKKQFKEMENAGKGFVQTMEQSTKGLDAAGPAAAIDKLTQAFNPLKQASREADEAFQSWRNSANLIPGIANTIVGSFSGLGAAVRVAATAFGTLGVSATAILPILAGLGRNTSQFITELDKASKNAGISSDSFQTFARGAERAGISSRDLSGDLAKIDRELGNIGLATQKAAADLSGSIRRVGADLKPIPRDIEQVGKTLVENFQVGEQTVRVYRGSLKDAAVESSAFAQKAKELGVSLRDSNGKLKDSETVIKELANAIARIPDSANRRSLIDAFGLKTLAELVEKGVQEVEKQGENAKKVLDNFTKEELEAAKRNEEATNRLKAAWQDFKDALGRGAPQDIDTGLKNWANREVEGASKVLDEFAKNGAAAGFMEILRSFGRAITGEVPTIGAELGKAFAQLSINKDASFVDKLFGSDIEAGKRIWSDFVNTISDTWDKLTRLGTPDAFKNLDEELGKFENNSGLFNALPESFQKAITDIDTSISQVWPNIQSQWKGGVDIMAADIQQLGAAVAPVWESIQSGLSTAWTSVQSQWTGGVDIMVADVQRLAEGASTTWQQIVETGSSIWEQITEQWNAGVESASQMFQRLVEAANPAWEAISQGASNVWDSVQSAWTSAMTALQSGFQSLVTGIQSLWDGLVSTITSGLQSIQNAVSSIVSSVMSAVSSIASAIASAIPSGDGNGGPLYDGFASGGQVRGPGTGTSDSIIARLSNGEFVMRDFAVRKYGKRFMAMINAGLLPKDALPRFASGGLVGDVLGRMTAPAGMMIPRTGDLPAQQAPGRPMSLTIDGQTFSGLMVPDDTAQALERFTAQRRLKSTGRKGGWHT